MPYNEEFRALLDAHLQDWRIMDEGERMEVRGWLRINGVMVSVSGVREHTLQVVEVLIRSLIASEMPPNPRPGKLR